MSSSLFTAIPVSVGVGAFVLGMFYFVSPRASVQAYSEQALKAYRKRSAELQKAKRQGLKLRSPNRKLTKAEQAEQDAAFQKLLEDYRAGRIPESEQQPSSRLDR